MAIPFWKGEGNNRDFHFSMQIARFLEYANDRLEDPEFAAFLQRDHRMDAMAAERLITFLKRQKEVTNCHLPHRHHLLIESVNSGPDAAPGNQIVLHTLWGGKVNRPFAMALDSAWEDRFGHQLEVYAGNDCVVLILPHEVTGEEILSLVTNATFEPLLRKRLESSGIFGARFRECAGRALLLTRSRMNERMPLWMSRLRSQKLLDAVLQYGDFPILLEAWRTCLQDEFDLGALRQVLTEFESGLIGWSEAHTSYQSPMAQSASWRQINEYMYMGDEPTSGKASKLRGDLLREVVLSPGIRPTVARRLVEQFEAKRKRLSPGYSPSTSRDLVDWVKERLMIPDSEWKCLLHAMHSDHGVDAVELLGQLPKNSYGSIHQTPLNR
jgi:ATP-dependent Lhr-like helicase